jgi:branched-chain amino acid transport system ATP-binding protein
MSATGPVQGAASAAGVGEPMSQPLLAIREIVKAFGGVQALAGVSFDVAAGERVAVIGPNGAGKTTLFNVLDGQLAPDRGSAILAGRALIGLSSQAIARLGVGRTFQVTATFASMTVRENVQLALVARRGRAYALLSRLGELGADEAQGLLDRVGIGALGQRAASTLAYGDSKRLELAIALTGAPRLLLMDEPTAGLAPPERARLMRQVSDLARSAGTALLFTEHDMDVVFAHADRIVVLNRGRVIAAGSPSAVRADREVRAVYLGSAAAPEGGDA